MERVTYGAFRRLVSTVAVAFGTAILALAAQTPLPDATLSVRLLLPDSAGTPVPIARHVLLISEDPPADAPRVVRTGADGTVRVRLKPGRYTIESDAPVVFMASAYRWRVPVTIVAGRDETLDLSVANAEVEAGASGGPASGAEMEEDPALHAAKWQGSVLTIWTPTAAASAFLVDPRGLVVTTASGLAAATPVEAQLTRTTKVEARVLEADERRDVAVLWVNPRTVTTMSPVPLRCGEGGTTSIREGQKIVAIESSFERPPAVAAGTVRGVDGRFLTTDFLFEAEGTGGPVFAADGRLVGVSSMEPPDDLGRRSYPRVLRIEEVCALMASAERRLADATPPEAAGLPVEPERPFPARAPGVEESRGPIDLGPYRVTTSSYDITFITPPLLQAAAGRTSEDGATRAATAGPEPTPFDPLAHFSNWTSYVDARRAVLMVRVTPRLVEGFWTKVARAAARTQGVSLPPITRFKPGFARLQAFCGEERLVPIHPFLLEQRLSDTDAVYEGLYVFAPDAVGPACRTLRLVLHSDDDAKGETRVVAAPTLQRIWEDFAPIRNAAGDR